MSRRFTLLVLSPIALSLTACVVVPLDPRTGRPPGAPPPAPTVVNVLPPAAAAPAPQPAVLNVRLYPLNPRANGAGMLSAVVVDHRAGRGSFSVNYGGETLHGEATRVGAGYAAFGRLHDEVLGASPRSFGGDRGIANGAGTRGISTQCEYVLTGPSLGTGVCLFSDGARYQMHFGQ